MEAPSRYARLQISGGQEMPTAGVGQGRRDSHDAQVMLVKGLIIAVG
jgi:hypothetical protein